MTQWQKTLLKFALKIGGVIILISVITLFLYYQLYFKKDNLLKYVPQEAVFYATFRLNNGLQENKIIKNFFQQLQTDYAWPETDWNNLNYLVAYNAAVALIPNFENNDLSFDYLFIFNLKQEPVGLEKHLDLMAKNNLAYDLLTFKTIDKNILLVSNSRQVLESAKRVAWQEEPSLAQKVSVVLNLNRFGLGYSGKSYLDIERLTENLARIKNPQVKWLLLSLQAEQIKQLFLGLKATPDQLLVSSLKNKDNEVRPLIENVPNNTVLNLSFNNVQAKFGQILGLLKEADAPHFQQVETILQSWEKLYNFNWQTDILALFNDQAQIVLGPNGQALLVAKISGLNDQEQKINKIEEIIRTYLAVKYPARQAKQLPDYTYISQIIKNPNIPAFNLEPVYGVNLHSLAYEQQEFAYYYTDDVLFLANSKQIISDLITNQNLVNLQQISTCFRDKGANLSQKILIKGDYLRQFLPQLPLFDYLVINEDLAKDLLTVCWE